MLAPMLYAVVMGVRQRNTRWARAPGTALGSASKAHPAGTGLFRGHSPAHRDRDRTDDPIRLLGRRAALDVAQILVCSEPPPPHLQLPDGASCFRRTGRRETLPMMSSTGTTQFQPDRPRHPIPPRGGIRDARPPRAGQQPDRGTAMSTTATVLSTSAWAFAATL